MGFFNRFKHKTAPAKPVEKKERESHVAAPDARPAMHALLSHPRVSEKASVLTSKGTYVFNVPVGTTKVDVRKAVEKHYKVNVRRVNTIRGEGKVVRRGKIEGRRSRWKKALVTLAKGQSIELHTGV